MNTDWLTSCGLVPAGEGLWRDEATGLYVHCDPDDDLWDLYAQIGNSQIADDNSVVVSHSRKLQPELHIACERAYLTLDDALAHIEALQLAARLAECYSAQTD